ncbi:hypothetical protein Bbelb_276110 [Branchiostoma belcheri]|nr:hypothetical protein Bbelb_276110 [Branchiostoma belcheri]
MVHMCSPTEIGLEALKVLKLQTLQDRRVALCARFLQEGYATLLSHEITRYDISLAGLCEVRWPGNGETVAGDHCLFWSGPEDRTGLYGVALAIPKQLRGSLLSWKPVSDRLLTARLLHQHGKMTVIVAYGPTDVAPDQDKDLFFDQLQELVKDAPQHDITIVLTDANATLCQASRSASPQNVLGPISADPSTNDNGSRLLDLCRATNMSIADSWFPRKRIHHWTWYSLDGRTRKAIDHSHLRPVEIVHHKLPYHRLLVAHMRMKLKADPTAKKERRIDSSQLLDPLIQEKYMCSISNRFNALTQDETADWQNFKTEVLKAAEETVGRSRPAPKKPWILHETLHIIDCRRAARLRGDMTEYRRLNRERNSAIHRDRETFWADQATSLEEAAQRDDQHQVYSILRRAKAGPQRRSSLIKDTAGNILSSEEDCITRWREHFSQLLNHPPVPEDPDLKDAADAADGSNTDSPTPPVTPDEIRTALRKLKNGKAPGICKITAEMLKAGGDHIIKWLTQIINHFFTRILFARAISVIRCSRRPQQAGFMPNRSTIDHISALRLVIEKAREYRKDRHLYIAFVDLRAAFDTILTTIGVSPKIIALFQLLYSDAESCVRVNDKNSEWFQINSGVRQGCVAAPDLFNCVVDYLMSKVSECVPGVSFGGYSLADLEYADDTTLLADTPQRLRDALAVFDAEASKLGLSINWSKTELMHIGDGPDPAPLSFNNTTVNFVSTFNYLGSTVSRTGDLKPEIDRRRGLAAAAIQALWRPLWKHRHISLGTKLRVYNAAVVSILLYGAETWPLSNTLAARLDGFDSRCLRRILGVRWLNHLPGTELRQRNQQPPASRVAAMRRVRWYGHVLRLPPDHPTRAILNFSPQSAGWKRPRGAPRTRWTDVLAKDLALVNITPEEAQGLAQTRSRWREVAGLVGSTHIVPHRFLTTQVGSSLNSFRHTGYTTQVLHHTGYHHTVSATQVITTQVIHHTSSSPHRLLPHSFRHTGYTTQATPHRLFTTKATTQRLSPHRYHHTVTATQARPHRFFTTQATPQRLSPRSFRHKGYTTQVIHHKGYNTEVIATQATPHRLHHTGSSPHSFRHTGYTMQVITTQVITTQFPPHRLHHTGNTTQVITTQVITTQFPPHRLHHTGYTTQVITTKFPPHRLHHTGYHHTVSTTKATPPRLSPHSFHHIGYTTEFPHHTGYHHTVSVTQATPHRLSPQSFRHTGYTTQVITTQFPSQRLHHTGYHHTGYHHTGYHHTVSATQATPHRLSPHSFGHIGYTAQATPHRLSPHSFHHKGYTTEFPHHTGYHHTVSVTQATPHRLSPHRLLPHSFRRTGYTTQVITTQVLHHTVSVTQATPHRLSPHSFRHIGYTTEFPHHTGYHNTVSVTQATPHRLSPHSFRHTGYTTQVITTKFPPHRLHHTGYHHTVSTTKATPHRLSPHSFRRIGYTTEFPHHTGYHHTVSVTKATPHRLSPHRLSPHRLSPHSFRHTGYTTQATPHRFFTIKVSATQATPHRLSPHSFRHKGYTTEFPHHTGYTTQVITTQFPPQRLHHRISSPHRLSPHSFRHTGYTTQVITTQVITTQFPSHRLHHTGYHHTSSSPHSFRHTGYTTQVITTQFPPHRLHHRISSPHRLSQHSFRHTGYTTQVITTQFPSHRLHHTGYHHKVSATQATPHRLSPHSFHHKGYTTQVITTQFPQHRLHHTCYHHTGYHHTVSVTQATPHRLSPHKFFTTQFPSHRLHHTGYHHTVSVTQATPHRLSPHRLLPHSFRRTGYTTQVITTQVLHHTVSVTQATPHRLSPHSFRHIGYTTEFPHHTGYHNTVSVTQATPHRLSPHSFRHTGYTTQVITTKFPPHRLHHTGYHHTVSTTKATPHRLSPHSFRNTGYTTHVITTQVITTQFPSHRLHHTGYHHTSSSPHSFRHTGYTTQVITTQFPPHRLHHTVSATQATPHRLFTTQATPHRLSPHSLCHTGYTTQVIATQVITTQFPPHRLNHTGSSPHRLHHKGYHHTVSATQATANGFFTTQFPRHRLHHTGYHHTGYTTQVITTQFPPQRLHHRISSPHRLSSHSFRQTGYTTQYNSTTTTWQMELVSHGRAIDYKLESDGARPVRAAMPALRVPAIDYKLESDGARPVRAAMPALRAPELCGGIAEGCTSNLYEGGLQSSSMEVGRAAPTAGWSLSAYKRQGQCSPAILMSEQPSQGLALVPSAGGGSRNGDLKKACLILSCQHTAADWTSNYAQKELFYEKLAHLLHTVPRHDKPLLMGDFNARVGSDSQPWPGVLGPHESPNRNQTDEGQMVGEIQKAIKQIQGGKAPGPDGIPPEVLIEGGGAVTARLKELLQMLWEKGSVPQDF